MSMSDTPPSSIEKDNSFARSWMSTNKIFTFPPVTTNDGKRRKDNLKKRWRRATKCFAPHDEASNSWFETILEKHCADDRAYHTVVHLEEMFGYLDLLEDIDEIEYSVLGLAIFFHDAIYDPRSQTNETDSAAVFRKFVTETKQKDSDSLFKRVIACILATQNHKVIEDDKCMRLLLDMDICVLGKEANAYKVYAGLIRKEYRFVDRTIYCEKRAEILEGFLKQPVLFVTDVFRSAMESKARSNLRDEISILKRMEIPGEH